MRLLRSTVATCLAALLAWGTTACGEDEGRPSGDVIAAGTDTQLKGTDDADTSRLLLPTGTLRIFTGEPVTTLEADQTRDRREYDAPEGTSYLPVAWRLRAGRLAAVADYVDTDATPAVDVVVDGKDYRVPPPPSDGGFRSFYLQVDGEATDASLRVDFDGVTQTVDLRTGKRDPGAARALYRLPKDLSSRTRACNAGAGFAMPRSAAEYECELTEPIRLPYAAGAWAPEGSQWWVLRLETTLTRIAQASPDRDGGAWWAADDVTTTLRAGGAEPDVVLRPRTKAGSCPGATGTACGYAAIAVFRVSDDPPDTLRVEQRYHLVRGQTYGGYQPEPERTVTATGSVDLTD